MLQQTHQTLDTGLQSFAESSPDYIMAPVGLGSLKEQADRLAEYGRHGDIYVVHAAEGETVVPMEVLDANPKVRELLFDQMRGMGIDPQRYIVGNELNSLNPDTGIPEFWFKGIFKAIKKVVKSVVKIVKKAAPIVIPLAAAAFGIPFLGAAFGPGTFGASFLGSGIGTLVGGGSLKDALKSGLISGGLASLGTGLKSLYRGDTFMGGLKGSFTGAMPVSGGTQYAASIGGDNPLTRAVYSPESVTASTAAGDQLWGNIASGDIPGMFTGEGAAFGPTGPDTAGYVSLGGTATTPPSVAFDTGSVTGDFSGPFGKDPSATNLFEHPTGVSAEPVVKPDYFYDEQIQQTGLSAGDDPKKIGILEKWLGKDVDESVTKAGDLLFGKTPSDKTIHKAAAKLVAENPDLYGPGTDKGAARALAFVTKKLSPGTVRRVLPTAALLGGAAYFGGAFDPPKPQQDGESARDLEERIAEFNNRHGLSLDYKDFLVELRPSQYAATGRQFTPSPVGFHGEIPFAANGGPVFLANGGAAFSPPRFAAPTSGARFGIPVQEEPLPVATAADFRSSYAPIPERTPYTPPANYITEPKPVGTGFNAPYYYQQHEDVRTDPFYGAQHGDPQKAYEHFLTHGQPEKRAHQFIGDTEGKPVGQAGVNLSYNPALHRIKLFSSPGDVVSGTYDGTGTDTTTGTGTDTTTGTGTDTTTDTGTTTVAPPPPPPPPPPHAGGQHGGCPPGTRYVGSDEDVDHCVPLHDTDYGDLADGGYIDKLSRPEMYGQRARALVQGPGTEKSDSIPARLSNGEFVLTARAVRGADPTGQGDRYRGAQNLYKLMRNFEMRA